jgi:hypothetical protein
MPDATRSALVVRVLKWLRPLGGTSLRGHQSQDGKICNPGGAWRLALGGGAWRLEKLTAEIGLQEEIHVGNLRH